MGISLKPQYLKRYKDIAVLLMKYGNSDVVKNAGLEEALGHNQQPSAETQTKAEELSKDLETMGPAFVKVGQLLSSRADLIPPIYVEALSRLQDHCDSFPFAEVETIVQEELGVRISKAFSEFQSKPLAAASLAQIHYAVMRSGRQVAVKVQRPGIRESIVQDMQILKDVATFYDAHTKAGKRYEYGVMVDEFSKSIMDELDYCKEAQNLDTLRVNLQEFEHIVVPTPIPDYSSSKVLTMDFVGGEKVTAISPLRQIEIDGSILAEEIFKAYLKQILVDGFFHADPHPGNVLLTNDNRIALIDLGMVARLTQPLQEKLLQLLLAISESRPDAAADVIFAIGEAKDDYNETSCRKGITEVAQNVSDSNIEQMEIGTVVLGIIKVCGDNGLRLPAQLTMLGKTLLNLDQVGRTLDPKFDPNASVRRNASHIMQQRMLKSISPGHMLAGLVEAKEFADKMPSRVNKIMDLVASNKLRMKVDTIDETLIIDACQKIANRITTGLVLGALIVGAALLMHVQTQFSIFGYPGLAMICFLLAACGGFALVVHIAFYDQKPQKLAK